MIAKETDLPQDRNVAWDDTGDTLDVPTQTSRPKS